MSLDIAGTVASIINRLAAAAAGDAELMAELRSLARRFLDATEPPAGPPEPAVVEPGTTPSAEPPAAEAAPPAAPSPPTHEALPSLPGIEVPVGWARRVGPADADLRLIEARCRLKAEGARWAATRQRRINEGADYRLEIEPADRDIISRAKMLENCFLWMNHPSSPIPPDLRLWEDVAGCFDAVAMAVAVLQEAMARPEGQGCFESALDLVAEAQSALRRSIEEIDGRPDNDQESVYNWLRHTTAEHQIYVARYMRLNDSADPSSWPDIQERISELDAELESLRKKEKQRAKLLGKGKYHARLIRDGRGKDEDWKKVIEVVDSLVGDGIPPSNIDIRDMLAPIADELPDWELPPGFQRALGEIDRFLASQILPSTAIAAKEPSDDVRKVAEMLKGRVVLVIGGERRPHAHEALKASFNLKDVIWLATREHESVEQFEPYVARPDVSVVLLAIRWSSHSYGEVKAFCDRHGKAFVRLPGGYNPNQVAHQILDQRGNGLQ